MLWGPVLQYVALKMLCVLGSMGLYQTDSWLLQPFQFVWVMVLTRQFISWKLQGRKIFWINKECRSSMRTICFPFQKKKKQKNWTVLISFHCFADLQNLLFLISHVSGSCIPHTLYIHVSQISNYRYLSSIFVCLVNKFLDFQGIFLSQFRCRFTLEYSSVRIRSRSNMDKILLSFFTQVVELVWTDVN